MDSRRRSWHELHTKSLLKRERTHDDRLRRRKLGIVLLKRKEAARLHLKVPINFSFLENYEETAKFIAEITRTIFEDSLFVFLDFSNCTNMGSEASVALAAEIDRCKRKIPGSIIGSYPRSDKVYFILNEIGFFSLLGIKASKPTFDSSSNVSAVRLESGADDAERLMRGIKKLFFGKDNEDPSTTYSHRVYRALTEAMGNAVEHAYPEEFKVKNFQTCLPIWWRAAFKIHENNSVLMILFDQGAGIPNTLELHWKEKVVEFIRALSRAPNDDEKLALAMEKGRSRTQTPGRGQGSYDMQSLVRESSDSVLSIFSYKGAYSYLSNGTWDHRPLLTPLRGTLVIWKVCLGDDEV